MEKFTYLTQEDYEKGVVKITNADIFREVTEYNESAEKERKKIGEMNSFVNLWHIFHFIILFFHYFSFYNNFLDLNVVRFCMVVYIFVYVYFFIVKKIRDPKTVTVVSLFSMFVSWRLFLLAAINGFMAYLLQKHEKKQSEKLGYPMFRTIKAEYDNDNGYAVK